jgi:ubiquinone/menaquinone biosynthesis C-methylase UbiE
MTANLKTNTGAIDPLMNDWNAMAELDPLWAILSDPVKRFGKWDRQEFFSEGEREARRALALCQAHRVELSYGKMLDFGCGVGRMTRAFSDFFASCVGIDVSGKMIELARKFNADRPQCEFLDNPSTKLPFQDATFDFVFSVLVLQHLPTKNMILEYVSEFIRVAKPGGVLLFQLTNQVPLRGQIQGRRRLWSLLTKFKVPQSWLFKILGLVPIQMNGISRKRVEAFIEGQGAQVRAAERFDQHEGNYHSYYYLAIKQSSLWGT